MKKIVVFYFFIIMLIGLMGCAEKNVTSFRFKDWNTYLGRHSFIPGEFRYLNNTDSVREMKVLYESQSVTRNPVIYSAWYENSLLQESFSTPVAADESGERYFYDELGHLTRKENLNWNREVLLDYSYDYSYEYDKTTKAIIQTVLQNGTPVETWTETKIKGGYQLVRKYLIKTYADEIFEIKYDKERVLQFVINYKASGITSYDLTYDGNKLMSIMINDLNDGKKRNITYYEMASHDERGNITEMMQYEYDRKDSTKRQAMYSSVFSDFDETGNWQTLITIPLTIPDVFQRYTRKIVYD